MPTYCSARNGRLRLQDISDIEAIERISQERERVYKDWSGEVGWGAFFGTWTPPTPEAMTDMMLSDIYPEQEAEPPTVLPEPVSLARTPEDGKMGTLSD